MSTQQKLMKSLEKLIMAATYAEAGAFDIAREILKREKYKGKVDRAPVTKKVEQQKELRASCH